MDGTPSLYVERGCSTLGAAANVRQRVLSVRVLRTEGDQAGRTEARGLAAIEGAGGTAKLSVCLSV